MWAMSEEVFSHFISTKLNLHLAEINGCFGQHFNECKITQIRATISLLLLLQHLF